MKRPVAALRESDYFTRLRQGFETWPIGNAENFTATLNKGLVFYGFTLPLASAIVHSVSLADMLVWSAIALVVQIGVFLGVDRTLRHISKHIEEGNVAAGATLAGASVAIGIVNAACLTY